MATAAAPRKSRLFFALPVDASLAAVLAPLARDVAQQCGGRAVPEANLHATLAFLGTLAHADIPRLRSIADALPRAAFDVSLDALGSFGHAQVAWIGASRLPDVLVQLHAALSAGLAADGFPIETRPYHLHVTLARHCRRPQHKTAIAPLAWRIDRIALLESVTAGAGPRYDALASWPLDAR
jgi:2'-5' RNA ligase